MPAVGLCPSLYASSIIKPHRKPTVVVLIGKNSGEELIKTKLSRFWQAVFTLICLLSLFIAPMHRTGLVQAAPAQTSFSAALAQAEELMNEMTVAEKIGQLFLIGFEGADTSDTAQITQLIENYHIGGVMLSADNDNFQLSETPIASYAELIESLQRLEYANSFTIDDNKVEQDTGNTYIPLLIGIQQPGDGIGYDQLFTGVTQLPSQMAIGATWNTDYAYQTGENLGAELSALGFNLILGPSLDVVDSVEQWHAAQSFGSDPEWVSQMGQEYIRGLHAGSNNQMLVIAEHFPGSGNADRPNTEEISTVLQTLDELEANELLPFMPLPATPLQASSRPMASWFLTSAMKPCKARSAQPPVRSAWIRMPWHLSSWKMA